MRDFLLTERNVKFSQGVLIGTIHALCLTLVLLFISQTPSEELLRARFRLIFQVMCTTVDIAPHS